MGTKARTKKTRLETLAAKRVEVEAQKRELMEKYPKVFERLEEFGEEIKALDDAIKTEARKFSKEGETSVVLQNPDITIVVVGKKKPIVYNYDKATEVLDVEEFLLVQAHEIDPKLVEKALHDGRLKPTVVAKFTEFGELPTPAVTIRPA